MSSQQFHIDFKGAVSDVNHFSKPPPPKASHCIKPPALSKIPHSNTHLSQAKLFTKSLLFTNQIPYSTFKRLVHPQKMKISLCFTRPRSILGVCDFLLSDESNRSYIKNCPGPSMGVSRCLLSAVEQWEKSVYYILNMEMYLTKTHGFATGCLDSPPGAVWGTFYYGCTYFISRLLNCWQKAPA